MDKLKIEYVPIDSIKPYKNNAKLHPDEQVEQICNSIRETGFNDPIGVWHDEIVEGHGRLLAAEKLGMKEVPIIRLDDLTDEQRRAYMLAHNKLTMNSGFDIELLDMELAEIETIDMTLLGFDDKEEETPQEVVEDDFDAEPPEKPKSKLGDIYQLGEHRLMCGDSTNAEQVAKLMNGEKADMIFTDPPYNVNYADKNKFLNGADKGNRIQSDIQNDNAFDDETAKCELWEPAFKNMADNAKDYCSIYVTMPQGGAHMMMMMMMAAAASWQVKHELIWVKNNHVLGRTDYYYKHEPILFGWKEKHKFYGKGEFDKSVWEIPKPQKSDLHPTMKPIRLIANALNNSSKDNDIIMDLFGGSGSTLIACEQLNRQCFMMELDPRYVDVIIDRWETFTGKKAVKLNAD